MQVRCIKAFGNSGVGEIVSGLPDNAMVDPEHWEIIPDAEPQSAAGVPDAGAPLAALQARLATAAGDLAADGTKEGM